MMRSSRIWLWAMIVPAGAVIALGVLLPTSQGIVNSFRVMILTQPANYGWAGLDNYRNLFSDADFWNAWRNTIVWVTCGIALEFTLGLTAALLLNRRLPGSNVLTLLIVFPYFMPNVVVGHMWALMLDPRLGVINDVFVRLGFMASYKAWLSDPTLAFISTVVAQGWHGFPYFMIVILAGLRTVPRELIDQATVDGAGNVARFRFVTYPLLKAVIYSAIVLRAITLTNSPELILVMTGGGPAKGTEVLSLQAFGFAFRDFDFGSSGATSVVMLAMLLALTAVYVRLMKRLEP